MYCMPGRNQVYLPFPRGSQILCPLDVFPFISFGFSPTLLLFLVVTCWNALFAKLSLFFFLVSSFSSALFLFLFRLLLSLAAFISLLRSFLACSKGETTYRGSTPGSTSRQQITLQPACMPQLPTCKQTGRPPTPLPGRRPHGTLYVGGCGHGEVVCRGAIHSMPQLPTG
jgi:hypothetical protein